MNTDFLANVKINIPKFKYHLDPIGTGAFHQGEERTCDCCRRKTNIWYELPFYTTEDDIECICPVCISTGEAAEKFEGSFKIRQM